jgi:TolA-binding protein
MTLPHPTTPAARHLRLAALLLLAFPAAAVVALRGAEPVAAASTQPAPAPDPAAEHAPAPAAPATTPATAAAAAEASTARHATGGAITEREATGLVHLGNSLTDRSDYAAAEIAFRQVLNGSAPLPVTKSALLGLARMHRKQGALTKAAAIYEKYLKEFPNDDRVPDALLELGRTLRTMGTTKLAIAAFYNVINSTLKLPSDEGFEHYQLLAKTAQFEVAETYFQNGDYTEATKFFSRLRLLDLAPADRARAHFKSAYSLYLAGDYEASVTTLRTYLDQWPDDENVPEARYLLSMSLRTLKRPQEALAATLELLRAEKARTDGDPKRWAYWQRRTGNQLANDFFNAGDIINALAIYHGLSALSEDPAWRIPASYQIALCYERLGDVARACASYRAIVEAAGPTPAPEIVDIVRMAETRLAHVDWRDKVDHQVASFFDTNTGQPTATPKPAVPSHDPAGNPPATPPAL